MRDSRISNIAALLFGSILLIISEFTEVFGGYNNYDLLFSNSSFIFPLISGILMMISSILLFSSKRTTATKNSYILSLIFLIGSLLLNMQYLIFLLSNHAPYIWNFLSVYINFIGFLISLMGLFLLLASNEWIEGEN